MKLGIDHLFYSNKAKSTWRVMDIADGKMKVWEMRMWTQVVTVSIEDFEKGVGEGHIDLERHRYQNEIIEQFKRQKQKKTYGERHHWGK